MTMGRNRGEKKKGVKGERRKLELGTFIRKGHFKN